MAIQVSRQSDKYSHNIRIIGDVHDVYVRKNSSYEKPIRWTVAQIGWSMGMQRNVESTTVFAEMIRVALHEAKILDELYPAGSEVNNAS
jgi:hypothetical protein